MWSYSLSVCLPICLYVCLSTCQSVFLSSFLSVCLVACPSFCILLVSLIVVSGPFFHPISSSYERGARSTNTILALSHLRIDGPLPQNNQWASFFRKNYCWAFGCHLTTTVYLRSASTYSPKHIPHGEWFVGEAANIFCPCLRLRKCLGFRLAQFQ